MAVLFALIMVYGWQHFSALEYGYRIEAQKQQIEQLNEQNRQLRLAEAQLGDPARIDRMARQLGLAAPAARTGSTAGDRRRFGRSGARAGFPRVCRCMRVRVGVEG